VGVTVVEAADQGQTCDHKLSLSISIVSYHSPASQIEELLGSLGQALQLLQRDLGISRIELMLIDNSDDNSFEFDSAFKQLPPTFAELDVAVKLLQGHGNVGYGSAHNLAIRQTQCKYHLILNPDVILQPNCLVEGLDFLQKNDKVMIVSPYSQSANGSKQYLCKRYPSLLTLMIRGLFPKPLKQPFKRRLAHYEMRDLPEQKPSVDIPLVSGCFMLSRSAGLQAINGFDEDYFMYFEDFDLSLRIAKTGQLAYLPSMKIRHFGGNTATKGLSHIIMFTKSACRFFHRHRWRII